MKLELDFDNKTITVTGTVQMDELIKKIQTLGLDLKEWKLSNETQLTWHPFQYPFYPHPYQPLTWPYDGITCGTPDINGNLSTSNA
jgi:hypothetical protein